MVTLPDRELGDSLTKALEKAQAGDETAWETLFRECYPKVRRVVRRKLDRSMRSLYDSTDFASDVMKSLAANLNHLNFPTVDHLIAFLIRVAEQKVIDEHRRRRTLKRDVTRELPIFGVAADAAPVQLESFEPTASEYAQANETEEQLLDRQNQIEKDIIQLRREGHDNGFIAYRTGWNIRKVQRFLKDLHDSLTGSGRQP
jgi:RNA polymerase sigma factor (sigma-70 family)